MNFHWLIYIQYRYFLSMCGACLKGVFKFEQIATYFTSLRAKFILAPLGMPKRV
jgi:hypothetical protein